MGSHVLQLQGVGGAGGGGGGTVKFDHHGWPTIKVLGF